jgi:hypothetical protein
VRTFPRVPASVLLLLAAAGCRAGAELPPVPADHPASAAAPETPARELRGTASDALRASPSSSGSQDTPGDEMPMPRGMR